MKQRLLAVLLAVCFIFMGVPFGAQAESVASDAIVILYENDVHCAVDGYAKLAAMKQEFAETHSHVGVVSVGDYIQGSSLGAVSQGGYIVNLMNLVGYDAVTLGNHEFDYKIPRLMELADQMNTKPICSNFQKIDEKTTVFQPYSMVRYGKVDVAYIGITTPDTLTSSSPIQFLDQQGKYQYTFHGSDLYETVQNSIDAAKADGADYVVALSHLGTENVYPQWSVQQVIQNTTGLDVALDGHSHSVVESMSVLDKNGHEVIVSSTGTKFANIGCLTIEDGVIATKLIPTESYEQTDETVRGYIAQINEEYAQLGNRSIGNSLVDLTTVDADGNRLIRKQETNLGDFCADAYRVVLDADIGLQNGGGIRADFASGEITFNDILSVFPFNNTVCAVKVTGQTVVDMLELGLVNYPEEDGTFQQVSGITFSVNHQIPSPVVLDENKMFVKVEGERRVHDVKVLDKTTNTYLPIDLEKTYTVASHSYLLLEQGGGATMFNNAQVVKNDGLLDVELLELYITEHLGGVIGEEYAQSQNRITFGVKVEPQQPNAVQTPTDVPREPTETESDVQEDDRQTPPHEDIPATGSAEHVGVACIGLCLSAIWLIGQKKRT